LRTVFQKHNIIHSLIFFLHLLPLLLLPSAKAVDVMLSMV
jgi:hypothetical protein